MCTREIAHILRRFEAISNDLQKVCNVQQRHCRTHEYTSSHETPSQRRRRARQRIRLFFLRGHAKYDAQVFQVALKDVCHMRQPSLFLPQHLEEKRSASSTAPDTREVPHLSDPCEPVLVHDRPLDRAFLAVTVARRAHSVDERPELV